MLPHVRISETSSIRTSRTNNKAMKHTYEQLSAEFLKQRYSLMAFIRGMLRDDVLADDIFQEVWIQLYDACQKGTEIQDLAKWTRGVARNLILKHWRKERNSKIVVNSEILEIAVMVFDEQDEQREYWDQRRKALRQCIGKLPSGSRELLELRYDNKHPVAHIAEILNKSASSIMMHLSRIRKSLTQCAQQIIENTPS